LPFHYKVLKDHVPKKTQADSPVHGKVRG